MEAGVYHLEAEAVDKYGLRTKSAIQVQVGEVTPGDEDDWKDEIHEVILEEGEKLWDGDVIEFPDLYCYLKLEKDGSLVLTRGKGKEKEGEIWANNGKGDRPKWKVKPEPKIYKFYVTMEDGQMKIKREKPGRPTVLIYQTNPVKEEGDYKLGISANQSLVIFKKEGEKNKIVWRSNR